MPGNTTKYALRYALLSDGADALAATQNLALDVDAKMVGFVIDVYANRPAAGVAGRRFYASDTSTEYLDDGAAWHIIGSNNRIGLYAARPAANSVAVGTKYFATDQIAEYISDGAVWVRLGTPAGVVNICLAATADSGYLLLQGQAWPGTTGIYADIYARLGSPAVVPDFQTFVPVGRKSGDADFGTLLAVLGEKAHTLTIAEMPLHNHGGATGGSDRQIGHEGGTGTEEPAGSGTSGFGRTSVHTHQISAQGGGTSHNNIQPSKVVNFQAKL